MRYCYGKKKDKWLLVLSGLFFFVCLALSSCTKAEELPGDINENERPAGGGEEKKPPVIYVTGVGFPTGYDWRKGNYEEVNAYLVVLKNGEKYLNIPVGKQYHVSLAPDMHRLVRGHLYSDYSTEDETILSKDGIELFRYEGREMMAGFAVRDKKVYTLGMSRTGRGLTFRCNGKLLFSDEDGCTVGDIGKCLYEDQGDLCFAYRKKQAFGSSELGAWYLYSRGTVRKVELPDGIGKIHAIRQVEGKLCAVVSYNQPDSPVGMVWGDKEYSVTKFGSFNDISRCDIIAKSGTVYVKVKFGKEPSGRYVLWSNAEKEYLYDGTLPVCDFYMEGADCRFLVFSENTIYVHDSSGNIEEINGGYRFGSTYCASLDEGVMRVALSALDYRKHPILWTDGQVEELPFVGYVTSVVPDYVRR